MSRVYAVIPDWIDCVLSVCKSWLRRRVTMRWEWERKLNGVSCWLVCLVWMTTSMKAIYIKKIISGSYKGHKTVSPRIACCQLYCRIMVTCFYPFYLHTKKLVFPVYLPPTRSFCRSETLVTVSCWSNTFFCCISKFLATLLCATGTLVVRELAVPCMEMPDSFRLQRKVEKGEPDGRILIHLRILNARNGDHPERKRPWDAVHHNRIWGSLCLTPLFNMLLVWDSVNCS